MSHPPRSAPVCTRTVHTCTVRARADCNSTRFTFEMSNDSLFFLSLSLTSSTGNKSLKDSLALNLDLRHGLEVMMYTFLSLSLSLSLSPSLPPSLPPSVPPFLPLSLSRSLSHTRREPTPYPGVVHTLVIAASRFPSRSITLYSTSTPVRINCCRDVGTR